MLAGSRSAGAGGCTLRDAARLVLAGGAARRLRRAHRPRSRGMADRAGPLRRAPQPGDHHRAWRVDRRRRGGCQGRAARSRRDRRGIARDRHSGRIVVGVLRHGLNLRRATAASGRSPHAGPDGPGLLHIPAPADDRRNRRVCDRRRENAPAHRRSPAARRGSSTVRWAGALPRGAERVQAPKPRLVQPTALGRRGCILVALIPVATRIPALAALGMVTLVACGLIAFEFVRYSEARERIRHGTQPS